MNLAVRRTFLDAELNEVEVVASDGKLVVGEKEIGTLDTGFEPYKTAEEALTAIPQNDGEKLLKVLNAGLKELKRETIESAVEAAIPADSIPEDAFKEATKPFVKAAQANGLSLSDARVKVKADVKASDVMKQMIRLLSAAQKKTA